MRPAFPSLLFLAAAATLPAQTVVSLNGASGAVSHATSRSTDGGLSIGLGFEVEYLVVGGGGGGGNGYDSGPGGGGGAGGLTQGSIALGSGTHGVTVGAGGAGGTSGSGANGGNSSLGDILMLGGGGGGGSRGNGLAGGSGGGAGGRPLGGNRTGGGASSGFGNAGGNNYGAFAGDISYGGGGGGGAASAGQSRTSANASTNAGIWGEGITSSIDGTSRQYAFGGYGGYANFTSTGTNATIIGGGGAGASINVNGASRAGGSGAAGAVIVRYLGAAAGTGGTVSSVAVPGYTVHSFTTAGSSSLDLSGLNLNTRLGASQDAAISGTGDLTFTGPGTLTLNAANTYTGSTVVNAGTLALGASGSLSSSTVLNVASGAAFNLNGRSQTVAGLHGAGSVQLGSGALTVNDASNRTLSGSISGTGSLAKSGAGALTLSASNAHSGGTTLSAGAIRVGHNSALGSGAATLNGGALSSDSSSARSLANNLTIGGNVTLGDATNNGALTLSGTVGLGGATRALTVASDVTLGGVLSNGGLTKAGAGTLTLSAAATHAGGTTVDAGTLRVGVGPTWSGSMLGTGGITVNGATLQALNHHQFGFNAGTHNAITLNDGATLATGAYDQFLGALTINGNATITGTGNYIGLAGGSLTYVGDSSSKQATIAPSVALFNSTVAVDATLSVTGTNAAGDLVINGVIWQSGAGITKSGTGKLVLNAANTYTGATRVNAGTLALGASGSVSGSSGIHVASGSTLDVSAKSGFTLASGQTLSGGGTVVGDTVIAGSHTPGFSPGLQTFTNNLTYSAGSSITWELAANSTANRGTFFDGIDVQGDLTFQDPVTLALSFNYIDGVVDWTAPFWDAELTGTAGWKIFGVTGTVNGFANLQIANAEWLDANGTAFATARPTGTFSLYQAADGIYLNYTPVPEPSTYGLVLGGLALAGAALRRRRKNSK